MDLKLNILPDNKKCDLLISNTGDIETVTDDDELAQSIYHRLKTYRGELRELGHDDYGSLLENAIGEPSIEKTLRMVETFVHDALLGEERIERLLTIKAEPSRETPSEVVVIIEVISKITMLPVTIEYRMVV